MPRRQYAGEARLWFVPTISNRSAPTVAEINAGTDLTSFQLQDGLDTPQPGSTIDIADASSTFNKTAPGTYGGEPVSVQLYRDSTLGSDTAYTALARGSIGHLVVRRFGGSSLAATIAQKVEVWSGTVISRAMDKTAKNGPQTFTVMLSVEQDPIDQATVA